MFLAQIPDGTDGFEIIKQAEAVGSRSIRSDVRTCERGLGGEAAVVSQRSDETARPMPAPVRKASAQRKQASPRGRVCFNRGFWPVCHSESEPRETTDRARLSTAQILWIFVMLAEFRTARHPRKVLESVILHLVGGLRFQRAREFRVYSPFGNIMLPAPGLQI